MMQVFLVFCWFFEPKHPIGFRETTPLNALLEVRDCNAYVLNAFKYEYDCILFLY